jgi:hypothetical protein
VVVAAGSRFGKERGDNGKLIDIEAGSDGGWLTRSLTRWPWKRWRVASVAAWRLEPTRRKKQRYEGEEEKQVDLASSTMSHRGYGLGRCTRPVITDGARNPHECKLKIQEQVQN